LECLYHIETPHVMFVLNAIKPFWALSCHLWCNNKVVLVEEELNSEC